MDKSIILFNTVRQPKTSLQKESLDHEQSVLFFLQRILPRSFLGSEGKRPCPSMIKSSLEFYPRRMARTVLLLLEPTLQREAGFIFDRTFAPLRSRLRKVERDNRYVFVYSRHLDRRRDAISFFLSLFLPFAPVLYPSSKRFLLSSHLHHRLSIACLSIRLLPPDSTIRIIRTRWKSIFFHGLPSAERFLS